MLGRYLPWLVAAVLLVVAPLLEARAEPREPRVALVIGNAAYRHAGMLRNPLNDAESIEAALKPLGFDVIKVTNADRSQMVRAMGDFAKRLKADGIGLFFYAGHGIQTAGNNYLIPIDADIQEEYDTSFLGINVNDVLRVMESAGTRFNMLLLDACRDNPFERRFRSAGGSRGLAPIEAPRGALIAFATAPGKTAADGDGTNGLFTAEFLKAVARPGQSIDEMLKETGAGVEKASGNKQVPWINSSYRGKFYLHADAAAVPATAAAPAPTAATPETLELAAWSAVATTTSANVLQAFLREFPEGRFAGLARAKLEETEKAAVTRQATPAPAPAPSAPQVRPAATSEKRERYVARTSAKVRAAPSLEAAVVGGLAAGDAVTAKPSGEGWAEIAYGETSAYVAAGLLRLASEDEPAMGAARPAAPPRTASPPPPLRNIIVAPEPVSVEPGMDGGWMKNQRPLPQLTIRDQDGRPVGHLEAGEGTVRVVLDRPPHADRYGGARQVVQWSHVFRRDDQLWIKGVRKVSQDKYPLVSLMLRLPSGAPVAGMMTLAVDQGTSVPVQLGAGQ
jgi:uncharacterized caspase-like protein